MVCTKNFHCCLPDFKLTESIFSWFLIYYVGMEITQGLYIFTVDLA